MTTSTLKDWNDSWQSMLWRLFCNSCSDFFHERRRTHYHHSLINGECITGSGGADYAATKAALVGYTHGWARDLGPKNITVNLVQPGPIDTDMNCI